MRTLRDAIQAYYFSTGKFPGNHNYASYSGYNLVSLPEIVSKNPDGLWPPGKQANAWTCDASKGSNDPGLFQDAFNINAWNATMQELIDAKIISTIPHSHSGSEPYCYFNFVEGSGTYVLITTILKNSKTVNGVPPSVRPFNPDTNNKCSKISSGDFCLQIFK